MRFLPVQWHETLPSTNSYLRDALAEDPTLSSGALVATHQQTAGRGRHNRSWMTHSGKDLAFSFLLRIDAAPTRLPSLPMAVALGVAHALDALGVTTTLKWPNDVLVGGRKICGILSENLPNSDGTRHTLIVGAGVNVNMSAEEAAAIDKPATSLLVEMGQVQDVAAVLDAILRALPAFLTYWQDGGFPAIRNNWLMKTVNLGQIVSVNEGEQHQSGTLDGFGAHGELLIRDEAGKTHAILVGDLTI